MKLLFAAALAAALLCPLAAGAQLDPDPDSIGIYFDTEATIVSAALPDGEPDIRAYLILANPSMSGALYWWNAVVRTSLDGVGAALVTGGAYAGQNMSLNMPGSDFWTFQVVVNDPTPYPTAAVTLLARLTIMPWVPGTRVDLYVAEGADYSVTGVGGAPMNPSTGSWALPVAVVDGPAPVPDRGTAFGAVKAMFR